MPVAATYFGASAKTGHKCSFVPSLVGRVVAVNYAQLRQKPRRKGADVIVGVIGRYGNFRKLSTGISPK